MWRFYTYTFLKAWEEFSLLSLQKGIRRLYLVGKRLKGVKTSDYCALYEKYKFFLTLNIYVGLLLSGLIVLWKIS